MHVCMYVTHTGQFNGTTHATKPCEDPAIKVSTPELLISDFEEFVGASFHIAELFEDMYYSHTGASH